MIDYNHINEFRKFLFENHVREMTVIEYRRRGGVWSKKRGEILSHPEFSFSPWTCVRIKLYHHGVSGPDFELRRPGGTSEMFFSCTNDDHISLDVDDAQACLHGFTTDRDYRVDIIAHVPTR